MTKSTFFQAAVCAGIILASAAVKCASADKSEKSEAVEAAAYSAAAKNEPSVTFADLADSLICFAQKR